MRPTLLLLTALAACAGSDPGGGGPGSDDSGGSDGTDAPTACGAGGGASVELGTGEDAFVALEDGDEVEVINGPQGGQHILGSVRTTGMTSVATVRFSIQRAEDDSYVSDQTYRVLFFEDPERDDDCAWLYPGMYGYLGFVAVAEDDANFLWKDAIMSIDVTDEAGNTGADSRTVVPVLGEASPGGDPGGDPPEEPGDPPE